MSWVQGDVLGPRRCLGSKEAAPGCEDVELRLETLPWQGWQMTDLSVQLPQAAQQLSVCVHLGTGKI